MWVMWQSCGLWSGSWRIVDGFLPTSFMHYVLLIWVEGYRLSWQSKQWSCIATSSMTTRSLYLYRGSGQTRAFYSCCDLLTSKLSQNKQFEANVKSISYCFFYTLKTKQQIDLEKIIWRRLINILKAITSSHTQPKLCAQPQQSILYKYIF